MLVHVDDNQLLNEADERRHLAQLGEVIKQERVRLGLTAEQAAKAAKVAYKTWLRVESGQPVRNLTWNGVDRLFSLPAGTALRAKGTEWGLNLRYEIQRRTDERTGSHRSGTAPLELTAYGEVVAPAAKIEGQGTVSGQEELYDFSRPILNDSVLARIPLDKRLLGLDLEGLRRLRDMVEGAILVTERPSIEAQRQKAFEAFEHANHEVAVLDVMQAHDQAQLESARKELMDAEKAGDKTGALKLKDVIRHLEDRLMDIRNHLLSVTEARARTRAELEVVQSRIDRAERHRRELEDAEHGETPER